MKVGQSEIIHWHQNLTPQQSIEAVMAKIDLGDNLGINFRRHNGPFKAKDGSSALVLTNVIALKARLPVRGF